MTEGQAIVVPIKSSFWQRFCQLCVSLVSYNSNLNQKNLIRIWFKLTNHMEGTFPYYVCTCVTSHKACVVNLNHAGQSRDALDDVFDCFGCYCCHIFLVFPLWLQKFAADLCELRHGCTSWDLRSLRFHVLSAMLTSD